MRDLEFIKYESFVAKYYLDSYLTNTNLTYDIYKIIRNNIDFMEIIRKIDVEKDPDREDMYQSFYLLNLRILYHIPSNDPFINGIIVRTVVENLFRLSVSLLKCTVENIAEAGFSKLKESSEMKGFNHRYKAFYNCLCNNFGNFSKDVHGKNVNKLSDQEVLISIRTNDNEVELKKLIRVYKEINTEMIPFFLKEIKTKKMDLDVANLHKLLNVIGEENYQLFLEK